MPRKLFSYNRFIGLDTVTSPSNMSERFLAELIGAYVDFRGQIVIGPALWKAVNSLNQNKGFAIKHFGPDDWVHYYLGASTSVLAYSKATGVSASTILFNVSNATISEISLVNFDQKQFAFMAGHDPYYYNGTAFTNAATPTTNQYSSLNAYPKGGMAVNILNRLVVAGIPGRETELHVSVQDSFEDWRTNTSSGTTPNQTDGAIIDVKNQFTSRDTIQGLAVLEGDKLVVFGQNETLVYLADTNINLWEIARDFRVPIGIFGRNTAVNVGTDVFFCSRFGIHSLKRAASGLTLETMTFTREVQDLFLSLVEKTDDGASPFNDTGPRAVFDGTLGQYRVFFPQDQENNSQTFAELRFTYDPNAGRSGHLSFSTAGRVVATGSTGYNVGTGESAGACFGSYYARKIPLSNQSAIGLPPVRTQITGSTANRSSAPLLLTSSEGMGDGNVLDFPHNNNDFMNPSWKIRTPLLSQGSPDTFKHYKRLIIRAVGEQRFQVNIRDSEDNSLQTTLVTPEKDSFLGGSILSAQGSVRPIDIPIPHRAKSISLVFSSNTDQGPLKILDFALIVDTK